MINEYPETDSWVEITGTFGWIETYGTRLAGIHLSSIEVIEEPGSIFVFRYRPFMWAD